MRFVDWLDAATVLAFFIVMTLGIFSMFGIVIGYAPFEHAAHSIYLYGISALVSLIAASLVAGKLITRDQTDDSTLDNE